MSSNLSLRNSSSNRSARALLIFVMRAQRARVSALLLLLLIAEARAHGAALIVPVG